MDSKFDLQKMLYSESLPRMLGMAHELQEGTEYKFSKVRNHFLSSRFAFSFLRHSFLSHSVLIKLSTTKFNEAYRSYDVL